MLSKGHVNSWKLAPVGIRRQGFHWGRPPRCPRQLADSAPSMPGRSRQGRQPIRSQNGAWLRRFPTVEETGTFFSRVNSCQLASPIPRRPLPRTLPTLTSPVQLPTPFPLLGSSRSQLTSSPNTSPIDHKYAVAKINSADCRQAGLRPVGVGCILGRVENSSVADASL